MKNWVVLFVLLFSACAASNNRDSKSAGAEPTMPSHTLAISVVRPSSEREASYLGLKKEVKSFNLSEIDTGVLVIEVFNMYCIHCQRAAPKVNAFYELLEKSGLGDKVKVIGVGRGNSGFEVDIFRSKYNIEFPLFPDKDRWIVQALHTGQVGTPHFLVFKMNPGGTWTRVHAKSGVFDSPEVFLGMILERSGLKAGEGK